MRILNTKDVRLQLPGGHEIDPGKSLSLSDTLWEELKRTPRVQLYIKAGYLETPEDDLDKMSDDELRAYLERHGITIDHRWGRESLMERAVELAVPVAEEPTDA